MGCALVCLRTDRIASQDARVTGLGSIPALKILDKGGNFIKLIRSAQGYKL